MDDATHAKQTDCTIYSGSVSIVWVERSLMNQQQLVNLVADLDG